MRSRRLESRAVANLIMMANAESIVEKIVIGEGEIDTALSGLPCSEEMITGLAQQF